MRARSAGDGLGRAAERGHGQSERERLDREATMGRATHDVAGRALAMTGKMEAAQTIFAEPAQAVAGDGVLAGRAGCFGFYGVASVLSFVALTDAGTGWSHIAQALGHTAVQGRLHRSVLLRE